MIKNQKKGTKMIPNVSLIKKYEKQLIILQLKRTNNYKH